MVSSISGCTGTTVCCINVFSRQKKVTKDILDSVKSMTGSGGIEKKIDNISTFLLRMNNKLDTLIKGSGKGSRLITVLN